MSQLLNWVPMRKKDPKLWSHDLDKHSRGEFSFAMAHVKKRLEDYGEIHTNAHATFVGLYAGHSGFRASRYVSEYLYPHLLSRTSEEHRVDDDLIREAFEKTEEGFIANVRRSFHATNEAVACEGSCCLVGIIQWSHLWIANLGDSRAVLGKIENKALVAQQLTVDYNVKEEAIREQLQLDHDDDPHIFTKVDNVFKVRGVVEVTKAIGDAYLKFPDLAVSYRTPKFHLEHPITKPVLSAEPDIQDWEIGEDDLFIIFATASFWAFFENEDAVSFVHKNPRKGIARTLIKKALKRAAKDEKTHDDISVVVLFMDRHIDHGGLPVLSVKGFDSDTERVPFLAE